MAQLKTYDNGLRVCVETIPSVRSVSVGIWVGVGSRNEDTASNGLSHYLEHMMFKGTDKMGPYEIARSFEDLGANINAFTSKEATCYYLKITDKFVRKGFSLLCDIFFNSNFPDDEMEKEKNVVIEEINMGEDSPEDICSDLIGNAIYGDDGLGKTIIGTKENVKNFSKIDIKKHISKYYVSHNTVISFAGNIKMHEAEEMLEEFVLPNYKNQTAGEIKCLSNDFNSSCYKFRFKDFEQSNIAFAFPGVSATNDDYYNQAVLSVLFGGGMSSRLFQEIRERKGLAYSVYSAGVSYKENGYFGIFCNNSLSNTEKVTVAVSNEIKRLLRDGFDKGEIERAKVQLISSLVFSQERVETIMLTNGKFLLNKGNHEPFDINKRILGVEKTTDDSVMNFAKKTFLSNQFYASYVGKEMKSDLLNIFRK